MLDPRKIITYIIITTLFIGCSDNTLPTHTTTDIVAKIDSSSTIVRTDSPISKDTHVSIDDSTLIQIKKQTDWEAAESGALELDTFVNLDKNLFYLIYTIHNGVSSTKYLTTFQHHKCQDSEVLEFQPDADLSHAIYSYSTFRRVKPNRFEKVLFVTTPVDKSKIGGDGWFKPGFTQENVEMKTDSTTILLTINNDSSIKRDTIKRRH